MRRFATVCGSHGPLLSSMGCRGGRESNSAFANYRIVLHGCLHDL
jgi:hypothetical protein